MNQKQKAQAHDAQQLVEKFNDIFPIGSKVNLRKMASKSSPYLEYTVRTAAFLSRGNEPVTFFDGISGYFSIEPDFIMYP